MRRTRLLGGGGSALLAAAAVLAIGGCGASASTAGSGSHQAVAHAARAHRAARPHAVKSIEKLVPAAIRKAGTLTVAADATYAPDEFMKGQTVVGMDPDLMKAIAATMGLKVTIKNVTFNDIIPSMTAGRFMIGASSFTDTKKREQQVDFVRYANVGMSFYTNKHGGTNVKSLSDICGLTVSVESGTTELQASEAQSKVCVKHHKKPVKTTPFPTQNQANLAVSTHRAQVGFADTPVAGYQVQKSHGQFKLVGKAVAKAPYGLAIAKQTKLAPAVKAALLYLMHNGTYTKIFKKWGVESIAVKPSFVKTT